MSSQYSGLGKPVMRASSEITAGRSLSRTRRTATSSARTGFAGMSAGLSDRMLQAQGLRRPEPASIQELQEIMLVPIELGANAFDAQRREVDQQLRQQRVAHTAAVLIGLEPSDRAEVDARQDEAGWLAVDFRHERHAHIRFMQRLFQLALKIAAAIPSGDPAVDLGEPIQIAVLHRAHGNPVA